MRILTACAAVALAGTALAATPAYRGVVEGYYGRPWGTAGRISLMDFMGARGLNTFIYGPKDDPYHHVRWRDPYPAKEAADFKKLLAAAKRNRITFYWAIHLGNFRGEYADLFKKLEAMYALGVRGFGVFFDDFGAANADLHAEIGNRVVREFLKKKGNCAPLLICPNVYWGTDHPYQRALGEKLDASVMIMWTGRSICTDIRAEDVAKITKTFRRPPFVWWNWPVNDYCRKKLLLGRLYGLDDAAYAGVVLNPMENCEADKIAVHSLGAWCRDPKGFDSAKVWEDSFAKIYRNPDVAAAMRVFAEHNSDQDGNGHGYRREESVADAALCQRARREYEASGKLEAATAEELKALFRKVGKAVRTLQRLLPEENAQLAWELKGWLGAECEQMGEGLVALELLAGKNEAKALDRLRTLRRESAATAADHAARFRQATFAGDHGWQVRPEASTRELKPLVTTLLLGELKKRYAAKTGRSFEAASGFRAFSTAKALAHPAVSRNGKYAGYNRILEEKTVAAGETFGLAVPKDWVTDYFHAKLTNAEAVRNGVIEVSRDGVSWTKLETRNHGGEMETPLKVQDGWRQARYRNTSSKSVRVKIEQFKFDVRGEASPIDELLSAL